MTTTEEQANAAAMLLEQIIAVVAEVTRYPRDILLPEAGLEEDLGIDSVKRAEILAVLRSRLSLPDTGPMTGQPPRTIADILTAVEAILGEPVASQPTREPAQAIPAPIANGKEPHPSSAGSMVDLIAEISRYPKDLLRPDAYLEEDLGFDAAMIRSILSAMQSKLGLVAPETLPELKTLGDLLQLGRKPNANGAAEAPRSTSPQANGQAAHPQLKQSAGKPFVGKVALVTGSGRGLGKAIAKHLAELGATVIVNSFHSRARGEETAAEITASGGKAAHLWGSVTNPTQLGQIFRDIESRWGGVDLLISNASNGILAPLKDIQPNHWDKAFRTNVIGFHQASLLAAEQMRKRGGGKIVAISSVGAQRYLDYLGCIATVKAAVESLVRYLAVELGSDNIQVNAVSAGPIYGELMEQYPDLEKLRPRCESLTPRNRLNDEQEVAEAVAFMLSSSGISGSVLLIDAGGCQRITV